MKTTGWLSQTKATRIRSGADTGHGAKPMHSDREMSFCCKF